jgi:hypothetical protein
MMSPAVLPERMPGGTMRRALVLTLLVVALPLGPAALANQRAPLVIETEKPFGPATGTFRASGAFVDSGTFFNTRFTGSALGAPSFGILHLTQQFDDAAGSSFTLRVNIRITGTDDPNVFSDAGTWTVINGSGAYQTLRGQGTVSGTENENTDAHRPHLYGHGAVRLAVLSTDLGDTPEGPPANLSLPPPAPAAGEIRSRGRDLSGPG